VLDVTTSSLDLQVISLAGWVNIMYYVQDAHTFWDWIYFVALIVVRILTWSLSKLYYQHFKLLNKIDLRVLFSDSCQSIVSFAEMIMLFTKQKKSDYKR